MPKRPISDLDCEDSHCLQSKMHVSVKEINQGICAASNMKAVYRNARIFHFILLRSMIICVFFLNLFSERTLNLLFQGSKGAKPNQPAVIPTTMLPTSHHPRYSQTILTASGQILSPTEGQQPAAFPSVTLPCKSCSSLNMVLERCRFCEGTFCEGCFKICCVCSGEYCSKCSIQMWVFLVTFKKETLTYLSVFFSSYSREECSICLSCATERGSL